MFQIASFKNICTDSTEILFSQILLKSKLLVCWFEQSLAKTKFFSLTLLCGEVSNKHCLLTYFIESGVLFVRTLKVQIKMCIPVAYNDWASNRKDLSLEACEQQRHRPACTSAQSDKCL